MDCIFCKIGAGEIPCHKVGESQKVIAFLDIVPANKGHMLIIPKQHAEHVDGLAPGTFGEMAEMGRKLAERMIPILKPDGYNLLVNNGRTAGQEVSHVHLHLIPRYKEDKADGFHIHWSKKSATSAELEALASQLSILNKAVR